jgi:hypothetical protein
VVVRTTGINVRDDDSLEALQSQIHIRFRHALETVTRTKLEIIDAEVSGENPDGERLRKLKRDLENGTKALETIERKLTLVSESLRPCSSKPSVGASSSSNSIGILRKDSRTCLNWRSPRANELAPPFHRPRAGDLRDAGVRVLWGVGRGT